VRDPHNGTDRQNPYAPYAPASGEPPSRFTFVVRENRMSWGWILEPDGSDPNSTRLTQWREQTGSGPRVFEVATSFKTAWGHVLERAGVSGFRWHDLRHHFASRLVQSGVPLNTVRDLLGHSSVAMSLRYAHVAPDQRCEAVAKLDERPLFALTVRLPWNGTWGTASASH